MIPTIKLEVEDAEMDYPHDPDIEIKKEPDSKSKSKMIKSEEDRLYNCVNCGESYLRTSFGHNPTNESPFYCKDCGKRFFSEVHIRKHIEIHISDYKCHPCDKPFSSKAELTNHQFEFHLEERFMCSSCVPSQNSKSKIKKKGKLSTNVYGRCGLCKHHSSSKHNLKRHFIEVHPGFELKFDIKCRECDLFFSTAYECTRHWSTIHRTKQRHLYGKNVYARCNLCDQVLAGPDLNLKMHFESIHPGNELNVQYKCPNCDLFFDSITGIDQHSIAAHPRAVRLVFGKCSVCNELLRSKFTIKKHFSKMPPRTVPSFDFKCGKCEEFSKSKQDLHTEVAHVDPIVQENK